MSRGLQGRPIIVTDVEHRSGVAVCRGLHRAGYRVTGISCSRHAAGHWSRACAERLTVAHPLEDEDRFIDGLVRTAARGAYDLLIPGTDASLATVSRRRGELEPHVRLALPPHEVVTRTLDKQHLAAAARAAGLEPPETTVCWTTDDAVAAVRRFGFPVLVKPQQSVFEVDGVARRWGSALVRDERQLVEIAPGYGRPFLVQRRDTSSVLSFAGVRVDGRLLGVAVSQYQRTWLPEAGNVAYSRTIAPPFDLEARVDRLLAELDWQGMFELELLGIGPGRFAAIDLNPRPYGSMALALRSGVNIPALWCDWVLRGTARPVRARPGVYYRWEDADLRHLLWQARRGELRLAARVLRPRRAVAHAYFELRDPGPLAARAVEMAGKGTERAREVARAVREASEPPLFVRGLANGLRRPPSPPSSEAPAPPNKNGTGRFRRAPGTGSLPYDSLVAGRRAAFWGKPLSP